MKKGIFFVILASQLSACSLLSKLRKSQYRGNGQETSLNYHQDRTTEAYQQAKEELGLANVELSDEHIALIKRRMRLNRLEKQINTQTEKQQYYTYKPALRTDGRRIFFLELPSLEEREFFAEKIGIANRVERLSSYEKGAINNNDIFIGMSKKAVNDSWGEPEVIEVAGNPIYGNERWTYSAYVPTVDGFQKEDRVIFFEGGRIVGWQKN